MDFKTLLLNRRSVRDYENKDVSLSVVKDIIQDTCLAPTSSNGQPCKFIIIQDKALIKRLSDESKKNLLANLTKNPGSPHNKYEAYFKDETTNVFYNAPCLVYFIGPEKLRTLHVDCALTVAYFMFSATSRGLGTCWIGFGAYIRDQKLLNEIGVPEGCQIIAPVIVGYPAAIPPVSKRHDPKIVKIIE